MKVSHEKNSFSSKDTTHDVNAVLFYWGSFLVEGDPFNEEVGPSSLENETGAKIVPRFSFSLAARNGLTNSYALSHRIVSDNNPPDSGRVI